MTLGLSIDAQAQNAVWQWSVKVKNARENNGVAKAYLWIAPECRRVRAFIFAQNNMEEQSILENPQFRKEMGKLGIAEVWVSPSFDHLFDFEKGAGETFTDLMNELAGVSGYDELSYAPFIGMGHSAAASAPYYMAAWNPERTLAAISVSGQWPYFRNPSFAPDIWGARTIDFVPCLETMGEYEAANTVSAEGLKERQAHSLIPLSMLANPAQGHFAATDEKCVYLALYIAKALKYRLPELTAKGKKPHLKKIDPTKTGWLVDKWRFDQQPTAPPAPVGNYQGDPAQAFWFFDEELAKATATYQAKHRNQQPQLIGYVENNKMVGQRSTHQQVNLRFKPEADGITFKLHAAFYDTVPVGSPRPKGWADRPVGQPVGHSTSKIAIRIDRITGPVIKLDDSTFRLNSRAGFWEDPHSYELWFAATHPGDEAYKPAVQQAQMLVPPRNTQGTVQHINFAAIPDQKPGSKNVKLNATSDARVPVNFYVEEGPAALDGNVLRLTDMPPRSKFPVKVTIVAWQYGSANEPKLQTAAPVARTFWIGQR
ncbi:MAG: hypothetical protein V4592_23440 [Bacteroidota bacterium]